MPVLFIALVVMMSVPGDASGDPCQAGLPNTTAKLWSEIDKVVKSIHLLVAKRELRHPRRGERKKLKGRAPRKAFASAAQISGGIFLYPRQASLLTEMVRQQAESAAARRQKKADTVKVKVAGGQRFVVCETG